MKKTERKFQIIQQNKKGVDVGAVKATVTDEDVAKAIVDQMNKHLRANERSAYAAGLRYIYRMVGSD